MHCRTLAAVALLVPDYDEACNWFVRALGFEVSEDTDLGDGKRWVVIAPPGNRGASLVLARASNPEQHALIGRQFAGRVGLFLHTDDFEADIARMTRAGVRFAETPRQESYGKVVVFEDLYGNRWDLIEPST